MNYTTSGVSQLVSSLEKEFGFALFHRNKKGIKLTPAGERMLPVVRAFLQQEESMMQMAAGINGLNVGGITVAAYSSISTHWLPKVIHAFREDFPMIEIKLMEGIRQEVVQWLQDSVADIGFLSYGTDLTCEWIPLLEDRMLAILPKDHPLAGKKKYPVKRLPEEDFIMPGVGADYDVVSLLERYEVNPNITFTTFENFSAMSMIENGMGMSIMNELITKNRICDVVKLPLDPPYTFMLGIAIPPVSADAPAVRRFAEYAVDLCDSF